MTKHVRMMTLRQSAGFAGLLFVVITLLLHPWRASVSQDDATYAAQALRFASGHFEFHPDSTAYLLPQTLLGAFFIRLCSGLNSIRVLNCLTWTAFALFAFRVRLNFKLKPALWLSFFAVPFWFQYGASFLYDIWAVGLLWIFFELDRQKNSFLILLGSAAISVALVLQLQTLAIFPALYGVHQVRSKNWGRASAYGLGLVIGLLIYILLKKSVSQEALPYWLVIHHQNSLDFFCTFIQLFSGLGFFLLPWVQDPRVISKKIMAWTALIQLSLMGLLTLTPCHILAAGVFFSDYLPRVVAAFFASVGIWGWVGSRDLFLGRTRKTPIWLGLSGIVSVFCAYSWRSVADLRYALIAVPVVLSWVHVERLQTRRLGSSGLLAGLALALSLFLNLYQLDTTEARWRVAQDLERSGVNAREISAGYGRDHFVLEWDCVEREIARLHNVPPSDPRFLNEVYLYVPRYYEKNWSPRFLIKPRSIFGKTISLAAHRMPGQDTEPVQLVPYWSVGFTQSLGVYKNPDPHPAECDDLSKTP